MLKNSNLFESIPHQFIKGAFLDRIHLYNPGWEIKMLKKNSFSNGYGLITDYIAAVLHELRNRDFAGELAKYAKFDGSLSERDHLAIRKTFSGLIKLIYPNGKFTEEEAYELIDFAAESRKRVKDQLYIIDETFKAEPAKFEYKNLRSGETVQVATLEEINSGVKPVRPVPAALAEPEAAAEAAPKKEPRVELASAVKTIRLNQTGVSYASLFGDYLKTASTVRVIDPFIRLPYQVENLVEFIQMLRECNDDPESLKVHLSTSNDDDRIPDMIDIFDEMKEDLEAHGIEFTYDFKADHDRFIQADNGWTITLGRGLDIFEKKGRFTLDSISQQERRCKEFNVSYNKR
jgi:ATP-dependent Lon protease